MAGKNKDLSFLTAHDLDMDQEAIALSFANNIEYIQGKDKYSVTPQDFFAGVALSARARMLDRWNKTQQSYYDRGLKRVYYLSMEFLIGRLLEDGLSNLGILEQTRAALAELGLSLDEVAGQEWDAGLGNGGLGRLAACFLDSMATLGIPAMGYGIRYEYGIFKQLLHGGAQVESPDNWLRYGSPWELPRTHHLFPVHFYGRVVENRNGQGRLTHEWVDTENVMAMAHDILVPGHRNGVVNTLRLWSAKATREFDFSYFNQGDYIQAVQDKNATENISRVLYPNDAFTEGRELRLKQEYFLVAATLEDALRRHLKHHDAIETLPDKAVFQLNDTHPAIAVAELMRILVDQRRMDWEQAWHLTTRCFAYTNHTVLPEALETWPVALFERVLPRHLQIIYEINRRYLEEVRARFPGDEARVERVSLIGEQPEKHVRMANLAVVGSFSVNGVSALHSDILRESMFRDFAEEAPRKFGNKTNGITPRRWLLTCNPDLAALITSRIGEGWVRDLPQLERLAPLADDAAFQAEWRAVKLANKQRMADYAKRNFGITLDPATLFSVQIKRMHEYKRQLLNVLHIVAFYLAQRDHPAAGTVPRTFLFAGKAAPGYAMAKLVIRLITAVGARVAATPQVRERLHVAFLPNYGVSQAERIIPAAEVSEQISTAGMEASGTGNMKLALNGALTVGTLDGANIEIREAVGAENFFTFGLTYAEASRLVAEGYDPRAYYEADPELRAVLDAIAEDAFSPEEPGLFRPIVDSLLAGGDRYLLLADFRAYLDCQRQVNAAYADPAGWARKSILTVAHMGGFSSDLTIRAYARDIWGVPVEPPPLDGGPTRKAAKPRSAAKRKTAARKPASPARKSRAPARPGPAAD